MLMQASLEGEGPGSLSASGPGEPASQAAAEERRRSAKARSSERAWSQSEGACEIEEMEAVGTNDAGVEYAENPVPENAGAAEVATVRAAVGGLIRGSTTLVETDGPILAEGRTLGGAAAAAAVGAGAVVLKRGGGAGTSLPNLKGGTTGLAGGG